MAALKTSSRNKDPITTATLTTTQSPLVRRAAFVFLLIVVIWLFNEETKMGGHSNNNNNNDEEDYIKMKTARSNSNLCLDPDDPAEWREIPNKKNCQCPDPLRPNKKETPEWEVYHQVLVQDVEYATTMELEDGQELDVILLGDSITEGWNGTLNMGQTQRPENRAVFEQFFDRKNVSSAPLQGLALGTSADITTELLWHLQNGMLPDQLQPKVWLLLIGTNDLGRSGCSKRTALAGILQVAQYLHGKRPGTPLLLHGLLPRNDGWVSGQVEPDFKLNRHWQSILWINRELKKFCALHRTWYYMEAGDLFLQRINDTDHPDGDAKGAVMINKDLMPDALHPNEAGYEVWGPRIVEEVLKLIPN